MNKEQEFLMFSLQVLVALLVTKGVFTEKEHTEAIRDAVKRRIEKDK